MKRSGMILAICMVLGMAAFGQSDAMKPAPEHKKLDVFAGSWTLSGDLMATSMSPSGKMSETEQCEWMEGNFFLVCHADAKTTMGNGTAISFLGYSSDDKAYNYREFNSYGEFTESKGSLDGDTWTWIGDDKMGGAIVKGRFIMKITSPTSYDFTYEMSPDGTKWTLVLDGKATKAK
jgi:Protein of unknown function (DUF1579)